MRRISRRIAGLIPQVVLALSVILVLFSSLKVFNDDAIKSISIELSIEMDAENSQSEKEHEEDLPEFAIAEVETNLCFDKNLLPRNPEKTPSTPTVLTEVIIPPPEV